MMIVEQQATVEDDPAFSFVLDLSQFGPAETAESVTAAREAVAVLRGELVAVVGAIPDVGDDGAVRFVEVPQGMGPVERFGLAMQLVATDEVVFSSTALSISDAGLEAIRRTAADTGAQLIEIAVDTTISYSGQTRRLQSSRTVVFWVARRLYLELRGLDLRVRAMRDAYADFSRRAAGWGAVLSRVDLREGWLATEPASIEWAGEQTFDVHKARGLLVNLPRWKYRPFHSAPTITVIRVGLAQAEPRFDASNAQTIDGYEVVDAPHLDPEDLDAIAQEVDRVRGALVAVVPAGSSMPPWRLIEQAQQIKSPDTYCVGAAAVLRDGVVRVCDSTLQAQGPLDGLSPLSTVLAPKKVLSELLRGVSSARLKRVRSNKVCLLGHSWDAMELRDASETEVARYSPYLAGASGTVAMHLNQYTVGRIDYIGAYERIAAIATLFDASKKPIREMAAVAEPTVADLECLADLGLPFELVARSEPSHDAGSLLLADLLGRHYSGVVGVTPVRHNGDDTAEVSTQADLVFLRVLHVAEGWLRVTAAPATSAGATTSAEILERGAALCCLK